MTIITKDPLASSDALSRTDAQNSLARPLFVFGWQFAMMPLTLSDIYCQLFFRSGSKRMYKWIYGLRKPCVDRTDGQTNQYRESWNWNAQHYMQFLCSFSPSSSLFSQFRWLLLMVALITPLFNFKWEEASKQGLRKHPRVKSILPTEVSAGCLAVHCVHPPQQHIYHSWTMRGKWPNWPIIQKQKCRFCIMSVGEMCRIGCCWTEASVGVLLLLRGDLIFRVIGLVLFTPVRFSC